MRVAALFRYPVKGLTGEECESLDVLPGGRIAGDRVLGLRFHDYTRADDACDGHARLASVIEQYVLGLAENPLAGHIDRLPLRVVGDGITPRYQDREAGYTTLHGRGSLATPSAAVGEMPTLTERRFRSNIAIDGGNPGKSSRGSAAHCALGTRSSRWQIQCQGVLRPTQIP